MRVALLALAAWVGTSEWNTTAPSCANTRCRIVGRRLRSPRIGSESSNLSQPASLAGNRDGPAESEDDLQPRTADRRYSLRQLIVGIDDAAVGGNSLQNPFTDTTTPDEHHAQDSCECRPRVIEIQYESGSACMQERSLSAQRAAWVSPSSSADGMCDDVPLSKAQRAKVTERHVDCFRPSCLSTMTQTTPPIADSSSARTDLLMGQFLRWVAERPRSDADVMDAWRTSCPRMSIWEDAQADGLVQMVGQAVTLTEQGLERLRVSFCGNRQIRMPPSAACHPLRGCGMAGTVGNCSGRRMAGRWQCDRDSVACALVTSMTLTTTYDLAADRTGG